MEWVEVTGVTVEEARERALDRLGVDISDADVEVLQEAGRSMLGLRKVEARVRARVRPTAPPARQERNDRRRGQAKRGAQGRGAKGSPSRSGPRDRSGGDSSGARARKSADSQESGPQGGQGQRPARGAKTGTARRESASKDTAATARKGRPQDDGASDPSTRKRSRTLSVPATAAVASGIVDVTTGPDDTEAGSKRTRRRSLADTGIAGASGLNSESSSVEEVTRSGVRRRQRTLATTPQASVASAPADAVETHTRVRKLSSTAASSPRSSSSTPQDQQEVTESEEETVMEEVSVDEQGAMVVEFLDGLVEAFGVTATASIAAIGEDSVDVAVTGDSLGLLIGPGGHTLSALTEVTKTVLQRQNNGASRARVRIDVAGYRERRRIALDAFTHEVAETVKSTGEPRALEPMHSADRKVVHDTANDIDGVGTVSDGDEPRRRVVIVPES